MMLRYVFILGLIGSLSGMLQNCSAAMASPSPDPTAQSCLTLLKQIPLPKGQSFDSNLCSGTEVLNSCASANGQPIQHWDKPSSNLDAKRIMVIGGFHGDEPISTTLAVLWMDRLKSIDPRNHWRFIPLINPDGFKLKTRTNANKVDINRNFPTVGWEKDAMKWWQKAAKKHPHKFPGSAPGSEPETKCVVQEIEAFKPDLVIAIHAPFGVLDFDGPRVKGFSPYKRLRWKTLGNYPGSLGRFLWRDKTIPVLTVELYGDMTPNELEQYKSLQDVIGKLAVTVTAKK
jgi:hypothetical protein